MPAMKSAQDRMIEYFVGAELGEAQQTLKTAGVILRARGAQGRTAGAVVAGKKRGRPKKAVGTVVTGAMPPGAKPLATDTGIHKE